MFNWFVQLLAEWQHPFLKCGRVGHSVRIVVKPTAGKTQGLFTPSETPARCKRCGVFLTIYGWVRETIHADQV